MQSVNPSFNAVMKRLKKMSLSSPNSSLFCSVCQVHVSSVLVMEDHVKGKKHSQLEQRQREQAASLPQSIFVRGFPAGSTVDQLTEFFQQFGTVNKVILDREYGHYAIIEFNEDSTAKSLLSKSSVFMNSSRLTIRPRQMKGIQPKRKARQGSECPLQKLSSAVTSTTTASSTGIDFEQIKEKLKECNSLEEEMDLVLSETSLSSDEIIIRQEILSELEAVLQRNFCRDCQVHLFGSSVNGLGTKGCDLDLFLDLRLEESSSHFSKDCELGQQNIQMPHESRDSLVLANSMTCDDSVTHDNDDSATCENDDSVTRDNDDSATCENDDSVTRENDTNTENGVSRKEEEHKVLVVKSTKSSIRKISKLLRARKDVYTQVVQVTSARCPVIKFVHLSTSLKCDLSINNRLALRNTSLIQFLLSVDSRIRPLVLSIRHWARVRGVAGQLNAGPKLTNYALTMIVFFYLQTRSPPILPSIDRLSHLAENPCVIDGWDCSFTSDLTKLKPEANIHHCSNSEEEEKPEEREPLEELLHGFFEFYTKLDFSLKVICLRAGKSVDLNSFSEQMTSDPRLKDFKISRLMVQDPFVLNHNIASNVNEKLLLILRTELKAAATKCKTQPTKATDACPRPSLIPLFSSEPSTPLTRPPAPHLREIPCTASQYQGTKVGAHSFTVKVEASKLMAEALRQKNTFIEMQDKWCWNSVMIVRHSLEIFDIHSCLVEQPGKQTECATPEDGAASCCVIHSDTDDLQSKSCEGDDKMIQSEKTMSNLANGASDGETHNNESCPQDKIEACLKEANHGRKRYSSEDDDGKELKRPKSSSEQNDSAASSSEQNDSTENDSVKQNCSRENSCMEKDSVERVNVTAEPSNLEQNQDTPSQMTHAVFSAECSTHSRLWMGRKKLRKQLSNLDTGDYEKEVQVSQILSSQLKASEQQDVQKAEALLKFKIHLSTEKSPSTALMVSMETEGDQKSKEFSCFFFSFRSVVEKLVDKYGMEDIGEWKKE